MTLMPRYSVPIDIRTVESASELFPHIRGDSAAVPEQIALREFRKREERSQGQQVEGRLQLPNWRTMRTISVLRTRITMNFDSSSPGEFYRADARLKHNWSLMWSIVVRPQLGYVMLAGFLYRGPRAETSDQMVCYALRFLNLGQREPREEMLRKLLLAEVGRFNTGERPEMTVSNPVLTRFHFETADGATALDMDLRTWRKNLRNDPPSRRRDRSEQEVANVLARLASAHPSPPVGRRTEITQELANSLYEGLLPACEDVLTAVANRSWPPFSQKVSARAFVAARYQGESDMQESIVDALMKGQRRPSVEHLARRIMIGLTKLSPSHLRRLIRS